jgi:hypothetical protein
VGDSINVGHQTQDQSGVVPAGAVVKVAQFADDAGV